MPVGDIPHSVSAVHGFGEHHSSLMQINEDSQFWSLLHGKPALLGTSHVFMSVAPITVWQTVSG
jgi:hypothetical protein